MQRFQHQIFFGCNVKGDESCGIQEQVIKEFLSFADQVLGTEHLPPCKGLGPPVLCVDTTASSSGINAEYGRTQTFTRGKMFCPQNLISERQELLNNLFLDTTTFVTFYVAAKKNLVLESLHFLIEELEYNSLPHLARKEKELHILSKYFDVGSPAILNCPHRLRQQVFQECGQGAYNVFSEVADHVSKLLINALHEYEEVLFGRKKRTSLSFQGDILKKTVDKDIYSTVVWLMTGKKIIQPPYITRQVKDTKLVKYWLLHDDQSPQIFAMLLERECNVNVLVSLMKIFFVFSPPRLFDLLSSCLKMRTTKAINSNPSIPTLSQVLPPQAIIWVIFTELWLLLLHESDKVWRQGLFKMIRDFYKEIQVSLI
eukprot:TRINITY_DN6439_c0_g1_i5.p1 TRINITY_DN6439_c0_g1~~TRINITY_DN6439_c0_g1_i5.p1  ORF type:complete len:371 (-),score=73.28 TRINITY_DN6439_c0_g1_i5:26-1138(-)